MCVITGLKFSNYDPSGDIKEAKESFAPLIKQAEELAAHSKKRLSEIDQELKQIQHEKVRCMQVLIEDAVCMGTGYGPALWRGRWGFEGSQAP